MKPKLSVLENVWLAMLVLALMATVALGNKLMCALARSCVHIRQRAEREALMHDIEMWLEVQRGRV